jgi:hypothetical protein
MPRVDFSDTVASPFDDLVGQYQQHVARMRAKYGGRDDASDQSYVSQQATPPGKEPIHPLEDADAAVRRSSGLLAYLRESGRSLYEGPRNTIQNFLRDCGPATPQGASGAASTLLSMPIRGVTGGQAGFGTAVDAVMNPLTLNRWGTRAEDYYNPLEQRFAHENEGVARPAYSALEALSAQPHGIVAPEAVKSATAAGDTARDFVERNTPGPGQLNTFVVPKGQTGNLKEDLATQQAMRDAEALRTGDKRPNENVYANTGLFYGPEGVLRREVADPGGYSIDRSKLTPGTTVKLGALWDHPELYKEAPDLQNVDVKITDAPKAITKYNAPDDWTLALQGSRDPQVMVNRLARLAQLQIQEEEGLARAAHHTPGVEKAELDRVYNLAQSTERQTAAEIANRKQLIDRLDDTGRDSSEQRQIRDEQQADLNALRAYRQHLEGFRNTAEAAENVAPNAQKSPEVLQAYLTRLKQRAPNRNPGPDFFDKNVSATKEENVKRAVGDYLYDKNAASRERALVGLRTNYAKAGEDYPLTLTTKYTDVSGGASQTALPPNRDSLVMPPEYITRGNQLTGFARQWFNTGTGRDVDLKQERSLQQIGGGKRLTQAERDRMTADLQAGVSARTIAARYGVAIQNVYRYRPAKEQK